MYLVVFLYGFVLAFWIMPNAVPRGKRLICVGGELDERK
jgi:hypothetical protein